MEIAIIIGAVVALWLSGQCSKRKSRKRKRNGHFGGLFLIMDGILPAINGIVIEMRTLRVMNGNSPELQTGFIKVRSGGGVNPLQKIGKTYKAVRVGKKFN